LISWVDRVRQFPSRSAESYLFSWHDLLILSPHDCRPEPHMASMQRTTQRRSAPCSANTARTVSD